MRVMRLLRIVKASAPLRAGQVAPDAQVAQADERHVAWQEARARVTCGERCDRKVLLTRGARPKCEGHYPLAMPPARVCHKTRR